MRTTIELDDALLIRFKARARAENKTLRALFEEVLRDALERPVRPTHPGPRRTPFKLKDASVRGDGLQPGVDPKRLIEYSYRDRID